MHRTLFFLIIGILVFVIAIASFSWGIGVGLNQNDEAAFTGFTQLFGATGTWLAAIGTLGTVVTALYLANEARIQNTEILKY
ncbi:MAG TPA: hypothetical protein ENI05_12725 [Porticoccus sp.]|nr:hypothetical protein [Porticoccus sp.]